ncbi:MAG: 3-deoxy-D-manno-octulosonic acid transferase [Desulfobulbaceae bacterium]|nr:3-deoxy-D-manno-octulosonic acid transferase [Desulfobulbaceae bacterium]
MAASLQYGLYKLLTDIFFTIGFPPFFLYSWFTGNHKDSIRERLAYYNDMPSFNTSRQRIWFHAASVGEVRAAQALLPELHNFLPEAAYFLSTMTRHGQQVAKEQLSGSLSCIYAPLDVNRIVKRSLSKLKPTCYICLETELWPNFLTVAYRLGVKLLLLNGRLSDRSLARYKKIPELIHPLIKSFAAIAVISESDGKRFLELGADPEKLFVSGNVKYDLQGHTSPDQADAYHKRLGINEDQQVFIFGSTHTGEEKLFIDSFFRLRESIADAIFIIAPRHLNRLGEIEKLMASHHLAYEKFSQICFGKRRHNIILVDTMGELAALYSIGTFIYCGGSLVPKGGHNIMEAAIWGKPVYYGPHMKDFADAVEILESQGAGLPIRQPEDFTRSVFALLQSPGQYTDICDKARAAAMAQQGSARRQAELIRNILQQQHI